mmetsp:Transcript_97067/g.186400  ORF Transcript_97067/g.186400 Transcript_97067/m.186400 type:complete len:190 (-) Transcript_97067:50-619(-)
MILIDHSGDMVLNFEICKEDGPFVACTGVPQASDRRSECVGSFHIQVIEPVSHDDEPAAISEAEAAAVVAVQEAGFVEQSLLQEPDLPARADHTRRRFMLCTLNRYSKEFRDVLCNGPQLKTVRDALGERWCGPGGSLFFVQEQDYEGIMGKLAFCSIELKPSHLVVSECYSYFRGSHRQVQTDLVQGT